MQTSGYKVKKRLMLSLLVVLVLLLTTQIGFAQGVWVGGTDNNWSTAANWDDNNVPDGIAVTIDVASAATIVDGSFTNSITSLTIGTSQTCTVTLQNGLILTSGLTINSNGTLDASGFNLQVDGTSSFSGTVTFGSGQKTLIGAVTINTGAIFNAGTGTISFSGNLTINGIGSGTTFTESTATFTFPENIAYVITADGDVAFDKVTQTTGSAVGARTIEFQGSGGTRDFEIKTSYTRSGRSQGTILTTANLLYQSNATLIYSPSVATMTVDVDEWPTTTPSPGRPTNVTLSGSQNFTLDQARTIPGTLTLNQTAGNFIVSGVTLTIDGTLDRRTSGTTGITLSSGALSYASSGSNLVYNTSAATTIGSEWDDTNPPENVTVNVSSGSLTGSGNKTIPKDLTLSVGTLDLGSSSRLTVEGIVSGGVISGSAIISDNTELFLGNGATGNSFDQSVTGSLTLNQLTVHKTLGIGSGTTVTLNGSANLTFTASASLDVVAGILDLNGSGRVTNPGNVDVTITGTLRTGGTSLTSLNSLTATSGTLVFDGTTASENLPVGTVATVEIDNGDGVSTSTGTLTVGTTLTLTNGDVTTTSSNILVLDTDATATSAGLSQYVNGPLRKQFSGTGSFVYPVGTAARRSATFEWASGTFGGTSIIEITHAGSFGAKTPPAGISSIDENTHYIVTDQGTTPSSFTYNFTGNFEGDNFNPETRNRAMPETASSYTLATVTNTVNTTANTVLSGTFSALPASNQRFVFGAATLAGAVVWDGDTDNDWFTGTNWDGDAVPLSSNFVTIGGNVTVNIGGSSAAVCSTLTLGDGSNLATLNISSSNSNPLTIDQTSGTPFAIEANSLLEINTANEIIFGVAGSYDSDRTNYKSGSTVEYQSGAGATVQVDDYSNLIINDASGSTGTGTINVSDNMTKQGSSTAFTSSNTIVVIGSYAHTAGTATYSGGSGITVSGSQFNLNGGSAAGTISINAPTTNVNGGSFGGTVTFAGGSVQSIVPVVQADFTNLTINKSANNLTISGSNGATVSGTLTLTQGLINTTNTNLLTIGSGGSASGGSASSYVDGPMAHSGTGDKYYPLGDAGDFRPMDLLGVTGTDPIVRYEMVSSDPGGTAGTGLNNISTVRYWTGTWSGTFSSGQVRLYWGSNDGVDGDLEDDLQVASSSTVSGSYSALGNVATTGNSSAGTITSGSFGTVQNFITLGSVAGDNSLPVSLTSFTADADYSKITLNWQTESEIDNQGFNIYRATGTSPDNWEVLNKELIPGAGNTSAQTQYSLVDPSVQSGETYYYQLESVSYNGVRELFIESTVTVVAPVPTKFALLNNYPNPFNPVTNLKFQLPEQSEVTMNIYDIQGHLIKKLLSKSIYASGEHIVQWDATDKNNNKVSTGVYFYQFISGNFQKYGKMMLIK